MAKKTVIYWRDIPSLVIVKHRRDSARVRLSHRFQEAIDRAAMRAGKGSSDAYLAEWRRESSQCDHENLEHTARNEAAVLEAAFSDDDLTRLIRQRGSAAG